MIASSGTTLELIGPDEARQIEGGDIFEDLFDFVGDNWREIKKGFRDGTQGVYDPPSKHATTA